MTVLVMDPVEIDHLTDLAKEIGGFYIKVVIDIEKEILAAGAKMHVDEELMLVEDGSKNRDLWGGGYDLETKQITFDSIINNKPGLNNSSEILDPEIRKRFEIILRRLLNL